MRRQHLPIPNGPIVLVASFMLCPAVIDSLFTKAPRHWVTCFIDTLVALVCIVAGSVQRLVSKEIVVVLDVPRSVNLQTGADLSRTYSQYQCMGDLLEIACLGQRPAMRVESQIMLADSPHHASPCVVPRFISSYPSILSNNGGFA